MTTKKSAHTRVTMMRIKVCKDGPYLVSGAIPLADWVVRTDAQNCPRRWRETRGYPVQETYALCRCGRSGNRPFCDGTHTRIGFDGAETAGAEVYLDQAEAATGPELDLTDVHPLCVHAGFCDRAGGTWSLVERSDDPRARRIALEEVHCCPSGRLAAWDKQGQRLEPELQPSIGVVTDQHGVGGPLWVRGGIPIESADGHPYEVRNRVTLCRCGKSANKPFCDGRHLDGAEGVGCADSAAVRGQGRPSLTQVQEILQELRSKARPGQLEGMARYGMTTEGRLGVAVPDLRRVAKAVGKDHRLALQLWKAGMPEARIVAAMIDDPLQLTEYQMEDWVKDINSWDVCDQVCANLFEKSPLAWKKIGDWSGREEEFVKRTAFALIACLAWHDRQATDEQFTQVLPVIERGATDERNYVRKAVNWALRNIGKRNPRLNRAAIQTAKRIAQMDSRAARWVASNALKELQSEAVRQRLKK